MNQTTSGEVKAGHLQPRSAYQDVSLGIALFSNLFGFYFLSTLSASPDNFQTEMFL